VPTVDVRAADGATLGSLELDESLFGIQPHVPVMHQVVTAQLAAARSGTQSTRTRAEVSGGGAKPFRQKGTGRARQGSTRAPHWSGGGIALGPKPRSYRQRTPKKMIRLALASALSDRAAEDRVVVVDAWAFDQPSTRAAAEVLDVLGITGRVLVVVEPDDDVTIKSFRNLPDAHLLLRGELNAYDVLCSDWVLFSRGVLPGTVGDLDPSGARPAPVREAPASAGPRRRGRGRRAAHEAVLAAEAAEAEAEEEEEEVAPAPDTDSSAASAASGDEVHDAEPAEGGAETVDAEVESTEDEE
jgi:large subunit ribosomal protein L4